LKKQGFCFGNRSSPLFWGDRKKFTLGKGGENYAQIDLPGARRHAAGGLYVRHGL
jgi:hypothetical protein